MSGNYDTIAPFYDFLSKLVYGNSIIGAQQFWIDTIPPDSRILVVGGGTGEILEEISSKHPAGLELSYVEASQKMIEDSAKRSYGNNKVFFINQSIQSVSLVTTFDIIITPFIFDNFSHETAKAVFQKLDKLLKPMGYWLFADFKISKKSSLWQRLLLKMMYLFFRIVCNIEASKLPDTNSLFANCNYRTVQQKTFFKNFIFSAVYQKQ